MCIRDSKYTSETSAFKFDPAGKREWMLQKDYSTYPKTLFSPEDVTVTADGNVAIVDVIKHGVQIFDRHGNFLRLVDLAKSWGRKPNYPSGVATDTEGGMILLDFGAQPPFIRMKADGTVRANLQPKHKDGRLVNANNIRTVSYTHLTLPTILLV